MRIVLSNASPDPIYEQIARQIRAQILSGELEEGDLLPSIRALARDLQISVITSKRAYEDGGGFLSPGGFVMDGGGQKSA